MWIDLVFVCVCMYIHVCVLCMHAHGCVCVCVFFFVSVFICAKGVLGVEWSMEGIQISDEASTRLWAAHLTAHTRDSTALITSHPRSPDMARWRWEKSNETNRDSERKVSLGAAQLCLLSHLTHFFFSFLLLYPFCHDKAPVSHFE